MGIEVTHKTQTSLGKVSLSFGQKVIGTATYGTRAIQVNYDNDDDDDDWNRNLRNTRNTSKL